MTHRGRGPTLWEQATVSIGHVLAQVPSIPKLVVALEKLYAVALRQAQLVGTAGLEVICERGEESAIVVAQKTASNCGAVGLLHRWTKQYAIEALAPKYAGYKGNSRITSRVSPTSGLFEVEAAMVVPRWQRAGCAGASGGK